MRLPVVEVQAKSGPISEERKIPAAFILPPLHPLSTTIRTPWRVVSGPIRCAESACGLHLSMRLPVVEVQAKSNESEKFRQHLFFLHYHHFQLESEQHGGLVLDQF